MQIFKRKDLVKHLSSHYGANDLLYVFWISKDEMEAHYESAEFTDKQFKDACESVDTESEEQSISDSIQEILAEHIKEEEDIEEENYRKSI
jgi:hypothetical protein